MHLAYPYLHVGSSPRAALQSIGRVRHPKSVWLAPLYNKKSPEFVQTPAPEIV